jgi:hypothetical protein
VIHERHRTRLGLYLEGKTATFYHFWGCVILAVGAVMDVYLTGLWLPRAGAVVAGVAAWLFFFDPRTSDDWWAIRKGAKLEHLRPPLSPDDPAPPQSATTAESRSAQTRAKSTQQQRAREQAMAQRVAAQAAVARQLNALAARRNITYRAAKLAHQREHDIALRAQAYWLFIGTLIWAFGDIPVELLKCGRVPC